jgi:hypothetical protein
MSDSSFPGAHAWRRHHVGAMSSLRHALLATMVGCVAWVCFTLLYVAFWAHGYSLFQSIVVVIVSLLVLATIVVGSWLSFGLSVAHRWDD